MRDRRFGVAVAGCGGISNCHTYALTQIPEVRLVATVDIDEARARDFQARYRAELASTDLDAVLSRDDIDAVVITTANDMHAPLALRSLEAGKHVLVQKPMALTLEEADRMIAAADGADKKLMVSFFEFFHPAFKRAKELVEAGSIGDVFFYKAIMAWYVPSMQAWRFDPKVSGGGVIMDGHVHHVAYFLHLLGNPPIESVYAEYGALNSTARVEDTAVTLLRTPRVLAEIDGSNRLQEPNAQNGRSFKEIVEIFGSKGTIRIHPTRRPSLSVHLADADPGEGLAGGWIAPRLEPVPQTHRPYSNHFNPDENPWVAEHQHFVDCCLNDEPLVSDGRFGRKVQEILMTAYEAGRAGRRLPLGSAVAGARS
jgi:predicted dehydrogenase